MALEGTLSDFSLADIFQLIGIQHKTGVLTLSNAAATIRVHFQDGKVVNADSLRREDEDRLGHVLVRTGRITAEQLQEALRTQKDTLQQLGHILVSRGYVSEPSLNESLRMQVTQMVYRLFRWKEGEFHFDQDATVVALYDSFEPMASEGILMEGVRMLDEWPIIESRISGPDLVFRKSHPSAKVEVVAELEGSDNDDDTHFRELIGEGRGERRIKLTPHEADVYSRLDGQRTVRDVVDSVGMYEFDACKALYDMAERNLILEISSGEAPPAAGVAAPSAPKEMHSGLLMGLYAVLAVWLVVALATSQHNPLDYWAVPPTANMKVDAFRAAGLKLSLERLSLALEAYHATRGAYPDGLDALVADGLILPADALGPDGTPVHYQIEGDGFTLSYSKQ